MPLAFRHRDDFSPRKPALPRFAVHHERNATAMARLQQRDQSEIESRFAAGHRAYIATVAGQSAAWGWVATRSASIGELQTSFVVPKTDRYLWNFVTLPAFRGRGIYPRLLDAIVEAESFDGESFWIAYAPENRASGVGIVNAGFTLVAELSFDLSGAPAVKGILGGGVTASRFLGLPEIQEAVAQCWKCTSGAMRAEAACAAGSCSCDYQRADVLCAS